MSSFGVIKTEPPMKCELCGVIAETRPYGPNGERICFKCGQKDPVTVVKKMAKYLLGEDLTDAEAKQLSDKCLMEG